MSPKVPVRVSEYESDGSMFMSSSDDEPGEYVPDVGGS